MASTTSMNSHRYLWKGGMFGDGLRGCTHLRALRRFRFDHAVLTIEPDIVVVVVINKDRHVSHIDRRLDTIYTPRLKERS